MKLKHSAVLQLQSVVTELNGNNTGRAEFLFQNLVIMNLVALHVNFHDVFSC